jgi:hypothetical protein
VTYGCFVASTEPPVVSAEHRRVAMVSRPGVAALTMPDGYKRSVSTWFDLLAGQSAGPPRV